MKYQVIVLVYVSSAALTRIIGTELPTVGGLNRVPTGREYVTSRCSEVNTHTIQRRPTNIIIVKMIDTTP